MTRKSDLELFLLFFNDDDVMVVAKIKKLERILQSNLAAWASRLACL